MFHLRRCEPSLGGGAGEDGPYDIVLRAEGPACLYEIRMDLYQERWWLTETTGGGVRLSESRHDSLDAAMLALTALVTARVRSRIVETPYDRGGGR